MPVFCFAKTLILFAFLSFVKCVENVGELKKLFEKFSIQFFSDFILPKNTAQKLFTNNTDELFLMFMGDTQYHFPCTASNAPCKEASQEFRSQNDLNWVSIFWKSLI